MVPRHAEIQSAFKGVVFTFSSRGSRDFCGSRGFECEKRTTPFLNNLLPTLRLWPCPFWRFQIFSGSARFWSRTSEVWPCLHALDHSQTERTKPSHSQSLANLSRTFAPRPVQNLVMRFFFSFFKAVFVNGALPSRHHQNSLEGFAVFCQSTFCWQAGVTCWEHSQLNRDSCQAEKKKSPGVRFRERDPANGPGPKIWENGLRFFLAFSNPYFFSQTISHWPSNFSGYPQPLGVCAVAPTDCNPSNGTTDLQGGDVNPLHCQRRRFRFNAIPAHCALFWHIEHAKFRNFETKKWIISFFFRSATLAAQTLPFARNFRSEDEFFAISFAKPIVFASEFLCNA